MKAKLTHYAEAVPPTGAIAAHGIRSALGRPTLGRWTLFIRETVQNAWDAREPESSEPVRYTVELRRPTVEQHATLVQHVLADAAEGMHDFWARLADPRQWWLAVHDRGTVGLRGPERADTPAEHNNFADFVWNFGVQKKQDGTGGTYGCGRTVFFAASAPSPSEPGGSVALIHSRYRDEDRIRARLIAVGLGDSFTQAGRSYTGRHWWGRGANGDLPTAPLTDQAADSLAETLGLPAFGPEETGTTVLVPCCDLQAEQDRQAVIEERAALEVMNELIEAAAWHCWPKLANLGRGPEMEFTFVLSGSQLPGPDPEEHPQIKHFVQCLRACLGEECPGLKVDTIESLRPRRDLGRLALKRFAVESATSSGAAPSPLEGPARHTALMRAPKLIVKYLHGPETPVEGTEWAGVFLARDDQDGQFAAAEPQPHDDWVPEEGRKGQAVRVALRRINERTKQFNETLDHQFDQSVEPLGRLADALGDLLSGGPKGGPGRTPGQRKPGRRRFLAKIEQGNARLVHANGKRRLLVPFSVLPKAGTESTIVEPRVHVAINDGSSSERDAPDETPMPEAVGFISPEGTLKTTRTAEVSVTDRDVWHFVVDLPVDVAVRVTLRPLTD